MAELKIKADSGGGTVSLKGPSTTTSNAAVQLTLPVDDGAADTFLKSNGSGVLSWASAADATKLPLAGGTMTGTISAKSIGIQSGSYVYGSSGIKFYGDGSDNDTKLVQIVDGNVKLASGKGIDFSATSDGSGTDSSELLEDYEEGSFTGTWTGYTTAATTTATSTNYYTKIGQQVTCYINLANATIAGGGGAIKMEGLPYATSSNSDGGQTCSTLLTYKVDFDTDRNQTFYTWQSVSFIIGYQSRSGNTWTAWDISDFHDGNRYCQFTFTYRTD